MRVRLAVADEGKDFAIDDAALCGGIAALGDAAQAVAIDRDALAGAVGVHAQFALAVVRKALVAVDRAINSVEAVAGVAGEAGDFARAVFAGERAAVGASQ